MPPPGPLVLLPVIALSIRTRVPLPLFQMPPASESPKLSATVLRVSVRLPRLAMPPEPDGLAVFSLTEQSVSARIPWLAMPPAPKAPPDMLAPIWHSWRSASPLDQMPPPKAEMFP